MVRTAAIRTYMRLATVFCKASTGKNLLRPISQVHLVDQTIIPLQKRKARAQAQRTSSHLIEHQIRTTSHMKAPPFANSFLIIVAFTGTTVDCIKEWRKTDDISSPFQTINTTKTCPVCRKNSPYVVPSPTFAKSGPIKDQIILNYRQRLAQIPCKYFTERRTCPFADACHYKHANPDGTRCILGPPHKKKTRSVCPIENFRYLEVSGESSVFDISAFSEILGLSRDHGIRHIFARDWSDNWDDKIDFAENPTWDDDFPFEDQIGSFASDNQDEVDIPDVDNNNNSGWENSEWEEWWSSWD
ncbi:17829_t:CDS:2 [Acaulospora morrowiae]|uniref:17829_t:CDS:1 n=1 Tax=Acaulospora morrowiae TaxID=94023 RepID=A0A9N9HSL8_9GLOM|nr:17829_t:CDS:2 [Acaulospora morrowiae]